MEGVNATAGNGRIRFWRDLRGLRFGWRYVSDHEDQPFPWETRLTEEELSFDLPNERCNLSILVERAADKHPVWLTADGGGDDYGPEDAGSYSLAAELIRSKLARLVAQTDRYRREGFRPQTALEELVAAAARGGEGALATASEHLEPRAAHDALLTVVDACDALELAYARSRPTNGDQAIGCDATMVSRAPAYRVWDDIARLFGYVTVTFYTASDKTGGFELREGEYAFASRDVLVERAIEAGLEVEGRPLVWLHPWVTPEWLATKDVADLRAFVRRRIPAMVGHYEGRIRRWEAPNGPNDWPASRHP